MRSVLLSITALTLLMGSAAQAAVAINVDKNTQQMTVAVDGVTRYTWPVSSGNPSHETPSGNFRAFRMEEDHYSKEFDDAPMPHSIFFTKQGHAIHGTDSVNRLGTPASHGCVRLSRENATKLWDLVKAEGVLNTTVTLSGSSQVALARNPRTKAARAAAPSYDADGQPLQIAPDQTAANENYQQDRTYYGNADPRWPNQQQRRVYVDPNSGQSYQSQTQSPGYYQGQIYQGQGYQGQGYYAQGYDQNTGYYARQRYYGPRNGY